MSAPPVQSPAVDLSNCAREPIHIPGAIQPHGLLLALREPELVILQASRNTDTVLGLPAEALLGKPLDSLLEGADTLRDRLAGEDLEEISPLAVTLRGASGSIRFEALAYRTDGALVLELEPPEEGRGAGYSPFSHHLQSAVRRLQQAATVEDLCQVAVQEVRRITGFDRIMVYRFDVDWHGEVIAEERAEDMEPFLGLHYPASDIPEQARRLYSANWLRLIADVAYEPVPLVPALHPETGRPLDMSCSILRSVSPVHIEYLKNMGVGASMSISLMRGDRLWGLIACHHRTARRVSYAARSACQLLGQLFSLHLALQEEQREFRQRTRLSAGLDAFLARLRAQPDYEAGLAGEGEALLALVQAQGAALCFGGSPVLLGETPAPEAVERLLSWLDENAPDELFHTDALSSLDEAAGEIADRASGLLAVSVSRSRRILWFRPEVVRVVNWSGDPNKPVEPGSDPGRLHPRRSFDLWKEVVRGRSLPWSTAELQMAAELRTALVDLALRRAEDRAKQDLEELNRRLERSNAELDSFAYIVSHDLKEPLRGIRNSARFLMEDHGEQLGEGGRTRLGRLAQLADRVEDLLDALLEFSRLGGVELAFGETDLNYVVRDVLELLRVQIETSGTEIRIPRPLPTVYCDRVRIREVFHNLVSNGMKYNDKERKWIEIGFLELTAPEEEAPEEEAPEGSAHAGTGPVLYVRDNGIGIAEQHREAVFQIFRRLHAADRYGGGAGAGLTLAQRIVQRHGGDLWFESELDEGTTFYFTLSGPPAEADAPDHA